MRAGRETGAAGGGGLALGSTLFPKGKRRLGRQPWRRSKIETADQIDFVTRMARKGRVRCIFHSRRLGDNVRSRSFPLIEPVPDFGHVPRQQLVHPSDRAGIHPKRS